MCVARETLISKDKIKLWENQTQYFDAFVFKYFILLWFFCYCCRFCLLNKINKIEKKNNTVFYFICFIKTKQKNIWKKIIYWHNVYI